MANVKVITKWLFHNDNNWFNKLFATISGIARNISGDSGGRLIGFGDR
jgi:hypothetical protein